MLSEAVRLPKILTLIVLYDLFVIKRTIYRNFRFVNNERFVLKRVIYILHFSKDKLCRIIVQESYWRFSVEL